MTPLDQGRTAAATDPLCARSPFADGTIAAELWAAGLAMEREDELSEPRDADLGEVMA